MNYRPTWAEISLPAYRQNLNLLARLLPAGVRVIAVLKANGYGHGAVPLAKAAVDLSSPREAGAPRFPLWGFGVSSVEEGLALRSAGLTQPILILGSLYPFESFAAAL
ncbi:MAG: alanine racemase, partial [Elusimicrobia bacterium]|nr:alanine racemase [Elusimicrobiota bacterium]